MRWAASCVGLASGDLGATVGCPAKGENSLEIRIEAGLVVRAPYEGSGEV